MGRTNIEIDDALILRVMRLHGLRTKRDAVEFALRQVDVPALSREDALAMEGSGWNGDHAVGHGQPAAVEAWLDRGG